LLHELAHVKRGDVLFHYAQTLLQIFYWWHPLLWLANAQIRRVREQAVDEMVMVQMGEEAETYPTTLLEVARLSFLRPMLALGLVGIVESKSALAQRIKRLLDGPVPKSAKLGILRLAIVAVVGALLLPMARGERKPETVAAAPKPKPLSQNAVIDPLPNRTANRQDGFSGYDMVDLWTRFFLISNSELVRLPLGKLTAMNEHRVWVLSPKDTEEFINH